MAKRGRPVEWTPERTEAAKELYLELLAQGYTERKLDAVGGLPGHNMRAEWSKDTEFKEQCHRAREDGVEFELDKLEDLQDSILSRSLDGEIPPHAVTAMENIAKHKRWKAGKLYNRKYGDKVQQEHSTIDKDGKPTGIAVSFVAPKSD